MVDFGRELTASDPFGVLVELTPGPGFDVAPIRRFLTEARDDAGLRALAETIRVLGITVPENPGGVVNLDPSDVGVQVAGELEAAGLAFVPHLSCKDHNRHALDARLRGYQQRRVPAFLGLTGDRPVGAKGVFDLDSVGLIQMAARLNRAAVLDAGPGRWNQAHRLWVGAAVSPFKYTEASTLQQYYKVEKKVAAGADFLVTQVGWDWRKSAELFQYLRDRGLTVPVFGNVFVLTTDTAAPRLMHDGKLPGCYVSDALYATLTGESREAQLERAAQQVAMYRTLGAAGVDIGGVHDLATLRHILKRAVSLGTDWAAHRDNLCFPPAESFTLYDAEGRARPLSRPRRALGQRCFEAVHRALLDPDRPGFAALAGTLAALGLERRPDGWAARSFTALEHVGKRALFGCEACGDCYLPENFGTCSMGGCVKGLTNPPCGDATPEGFCGNEPDTLCRGELIYRAAAATPGGRERLRRLIQAPRNPDLQHTSSILNYLFGRDHTMANALISIGEAVHASIPKTGQVMRELYDLGPEALDGDSAPLRYVRALIEDQACAGADYIAVNLDAFGEEDPQVAVDLMRPYVGLVRRWGRGVPVCIDSSDDNVLRAGLAAWYDTDETVRPPLLNSIKVYTADALMPLRRDHDFAFIGLLMSEDKPEGPGGSHSVEELVALAHRLHAQAREQGFAPGEIFFDSTVFPLAIDMPMQPGVPGYTYRTFETIRRIRQDPALKGVHVSLGVSNCCRDLPGRKIGVCRAYVAEAMRCGLDAGIVNINHHYGRKPADPALVALVRAFAAMDGTPEKTDQAIARMGRFCAEIRS